MIPVGSLAPDFSLSTQTGEKFILSAYRGTANVLLLFIPAAFTPVCSTEVPALAALRDRFWDETTTLPVVITADNVPSNREWARRIQSENLFLLSDYHPQGRVSKAYGAWIASEGIPDRATALIGKDGRVKYAESVGKFGKRSIPALLEIARSLDGRGAAVPTSNLSAKIRLDLPVLFVSTDCTHCEHVLAELHRLQLDDRIVVRTVDTDREAMQWLLGVQADGATPTLVVQGQVSSGSLMVIQTLVKIAQSIAPAHAPFFLTR